MIMFLFPKALWPIVLEQTVTIPLVTSFFTTWRASASDLLVGALVGSALVGARAAAPAATVLAA